MRFSLAVAALIPVLSVYAEDHLITVGANGQLAFSPTNITAKVGDTVAFQFQSKNHSATQSTFANPCQVQTVPAQGIDSTFQFVPPDAQMFPQWSFTIDNDTVPLWFFCAQPGHCQKGMVFSINAKPDSEKSFAAFQALAMGQAPPPAAGGSSSQSGGSAPSPTGSSVLSVPTNGGSSNGGTNNDGSNGSSSNPSSAGSAASGSPSNTASNSGGANGGLTNPSATTSGSNTQQSKKASAMRIGGNSAVSLLAAAGLAAGLLL